MLKQTKFQRILIIGSSCAGKTTLATQLADNLNFPLIELDSLYWEPNWKQAETGDFRTRVAQKMYDGKWIMDGNFFSKIGDMIDPDLFVWLDPPLPIVLWRFMNRTFQRIFSRELLWGHSRENLKNSVFSQNSLLLWIVKTRIRKAEFYRELMKSPPNGAGTIRLSSERDIKEFLASFRTAEQ